MALVVAETMRALKQMNKVPKYSLVPSGDELNGRHFGGNL